MALICKHSHRSPFCPISAIILALVSAVAFGQIPISAKPDASASSHDMQESQQHDADSSTAVPQDFQMPEQGDIVPAVDIARDPADVPPPVGDRPPQIVRVSLVAQELEGSLDTTMKTTYLYWTFNGKVPGPMIRVRQGDTVELTLKNEGRLVPHSIDLHAVLGPGGGMGVSEAKQGESRTFTFKAALPGVFVYHCGTNLAPQHISNGMYGLIVVEPPGGLPRVDREFYVMQGELYTTEDMGGAGHQKMSLPKLLNERPEYFVFNGSVSGASGEHAMHAKVGETVRIFFGVGGPNLISSPHIIGEILDRVYPEGSFTSPPITTVRLFGLRLLGQVQINLLPQLIAKKQTIGTSYFASELVLPSSSGSAIGVGVDTSNCGRSQLLVSRPCGSGAQLRNRLHAESDLVHREGGSRRLRPDRAFPA
jgi:copper-containing nitrite reductase